MEEFEVFALLVVILLIIIAVAVCLIYRSLYKILEVLDKMADDIFHIKFGISDISVICSLLIRKKYGVDVTELKKFIK